MHEGKSREQWNHTSAILCTLANANRDPKKRRRPFKPAEFNPWVRLAPEKPEKPRVKIQALKVFLPKRKA